jgi:gamma-glutamylputrescine oxidase
MSNARHNTATSLFWQRPDWVGNNLSDVPTEVDVAVVGAGLAGLSCAYHWLKENRQSSVVVFDATDLGQGASGRTTGMVTPGVGQDFAGLVGRLGVERAAATYESTREAVQYVSELIHAERIDCEHETVGQLVIAHGAAGEARLERQARAFASTVQPHELLDQAALAARVSFDQSNQSGGSDLAAIFLPGAGTLNPAKFLHGLAIAVQARGGKIVCKTRVADISGGAQPTIKLAGGHTIRARTIILATASESTSLAGLTGRVLPIGLKVAATQPLSAQQLQSIGWQRRECIIDSRKLFNYFRLTADNRIVFGGGKPAFGALSKKKLNFSDLQSEIARTFPHIDDLEIAAQWGGTIDYTLDGLPIIGRVASEPKIIYAGGFCGHGVALSVSAGKWVTQLAMERPSKRTRAESFPWFRNTAPLVPGEWVRRTCFNVAAGWMTWRGA